MSADEVRVRTTVDAASGVGEVELVRLAFDPPMFSDVGAALRDLLTKSGAWVPHELAHHVAVVGAKRGGPRGR